MLKSLSPVKKHIFFFLWNNGLTFTLAELQNHLEDLLKIQILGPHPWSVQTEPPVPGSRTGIFKELPRSIITLGVSHPKCSTHVSSWVNNLIKPHGGLLHSNCLDSSKLSMQEFFLHMVNGNEMFQVRYPYL